MNQTLKKTLIITILSLIPLLIGLPFTLIYKKPEVIEVSFVVFALIEFLFTNIRYSRKERKLWKNRSSGKVDKTSEEYVNYLDVQRILLISGITNILLSVLYFQFFGK